MLVHALCLTCQVRLLQCPRLDSNAVLSVEGSPMQDAVANAAQTQQWSFILSQLFAW